MLSTLSEVIQEAIKEDYAENYEVQVGSVVLVSARPVEQMDFAHYDSQGLTMEQLESRCIMVSVECDSEGIVEVLIDREWYLSNYTSKLCLTDYSAR